jgi:hypothetical protein
LLLSTLVCECAGVAELVDALDLGSSGTISHEGSSPFARTRHSRDTAKASASR